MDTYLLNISTTGLVGQLTHDFTINYTHLQLDPNKDYVLGLKNYSLWYSWFNISTENNNNVFRYSRDAGASYSDLVIPNGNYSLDNLNTKINALIFTDGGVKGNIEFTPNYNTLRVELRLASGYHVDFIPNNTLKTILGFDSQIYTAIFTSAPSTANITNSVDAININCSLLNASQNLLNDTPSQTLIQFVPSTSVGSNLSAQISEITYLPISNSGNINSMRIFITDQNLNILNLNGENVSISLVLKAV